MIKSIANSLISILRPSGTNDDGGTPIYNSVASGVHARINKTSFYLRVVNKSEIFPDYTMQLDGDQEIDSGYIVQYNSANYIVYSDASDAGLNFPLVRLVYLFKQDGAISIV